jgi:arginine exporter protein ArgO
LLWIPVLGVFCGSALWWLLLSSGVSLLRRPLTPDLLRWINRISGVILIGFAGFAILRLF